MVETIFVAHNGATTHMRTNKGDVALADTGCFELGIGGVLASLLVGFVEQFEEARIGKAVEIVNLISCRGGRLCCSGDGERATGQQ